eukprot:5294987-Lingulodinium_polyedra.AAC.1
MAFTSHSGSPASRAWGTKRKWLLAFPAGCPFAQGRMRFAALSINAEIGFGSEEQGVRRAGLVHHVRGRHHAH